MSDIALLQKIKEFKAILSDKKILLGVIKTEISVIADKYGDDRKTEIGFDAGEIADEDMITLENTVITMTHLGYIKRMSVDNFSAQNRGGKGIKGITTIEDDYIEDLLMTTTHNYIIFFTNLGRAYRLKAYEIPEASRNARGIAIVNLLQMLPNEKITATIPIKDYDEDRYLFMVTKNGKVKKTRVMDFSHINKRGIKAINLLDGDELIEVKQTRKDQDLFVVTKSGMCIRFKESDVRAMGRDSIGVKAMNLKDDDEIVGMQTDSQGDSLLLVTENGMGKRTKLSEFNGQKRGGMGHFCYKLNEKTGAIIGVKAVNDEHEVMLITDAGTIIQIRANDVSVLGRSARGVKLMNLSDGVKVAGIAKVRDKIVQEDDEEKEEGEVESEN